MSDKITKEQLFELLQQDKKGRITRGHMRVFLQDPDSVFRGPPPIPFFTNGGISVVSPTKFVAHEEFKPSTGMNVSIRGNNHLALLHQTERPTQTERVLSYQDLRKEAVDGHIITTLHGEAVVKVMLAEIRYLLGRQANGNTGALLTNGKDNVFYVIDATGVLGAVNMSWHSSGIWHMTCRRIELLHTLPAGTRIFSGYYDI